MRVSRFLPDFITQTGNTIVELDLRNFPNQTAASSSLGPFTITSALIINRAGHEVDRLQ